MFVGNPWRPILLPRHSDNPTILLTPVKGDIKIVAANWMRMEEFLKRHNKPEYVTGASAFDPTHGNYCLPELYEEIINDELASGYVLVGVGEQMFFFAKPENVLEQKGATQ